MSRVRWQVVRLSDGGLTVLSTHRFKVVAIPVLWFFICTPAGNVDYFRYLNYDIREITI